MSALLALLALQLPSVREPVTALPPLQGEERQVSLGYTSSVPGVAFDLRTGRAVSLSGGLARQGFSVHGAAAQAPGGVMGALSFGHALPDLGEWQLSAELNYSLGRGVGFGVIDPERLYYIEGSEQSYWAHTPTLRLRAVSTSLRGFRVPVSGQGGVAWDNLNGQASPFFEVGSGAIWSLSGGLELGLGLRLDYLDRQLGGYANASLGYTWGT